MGKKKKMYIANSTGYTVDSKWAILHKNGACYLATGPKDKMIQLSNLLNSYLSPGIEVTYKV